MSSYANDGQATVRYAAYKPKRHSRHSSSNTLPNWSTSAAVKEETLPVKPETLPSASTSNAASVSPPPTLPEMSSPSPSSSPAASTSSLPATPISSSTFRRVRPHVTSPLARHSSVLIPNRAPTSPLARPKSMFIPNQSDSALVSPTQATPPLTGPVSAPSPAPAPSSNLTSSALLSDPVSPPPSRPASSVPAPPVIVTSPSSESRPTPTPTPTPKQPKQAPYIPGFQPRGLYRPRTDEFLLARKLARDGPNEHAEKRVERTKLERRLEKIITLHFPEPLEKEKVKDPVNRMSTTSTNGSPVRPPMLGGDPRKRTSSFFDTLDLRRMSSSFLGSPGGDTESIRSAEQRISPWQPDSAVSRCPHCDASFHPLSNRKHHCRLCGRVVCALGVKRPQRPEPCSILFVVDPKTRQIEQVEEGVDYGVRKRKPSVDLRSSTNQSNSKPATKLAEEQEDESEKFLKGVRICRECRPVLLRQQYLRERTGAANGDGVVGEFLRLYEGFLTLEKEIEERLPQFEDLLASLSVSNSNANEPLTATATAERKSLLKSFASYDALAKKIRNIPCKDAKGNPIKRTGGVSSQERVQAAIAVRAARFLEARMVGLGALPVKGKDSEHKRSGSKSKTNKSSAPPLSVSISNGSSPGDDSSLRIHSALQPLLEQESLLESYVAEATAARKFEDAKTLRGNLREIRGEIERLMKGNTLGGQ
ncbi:hypothetical protein BT96DRAFT_1017579 [Gymnopus androsaceus JB14]|uniref:FYVE-type domain-containing protein n=1 Tax=Gymnopus androsaceus JB14 TaxID=1447944 RepID=A0A6A4HTU8_9AGAR|nr:hypothetical protein BT96DRAFT_1017579 [Gymnopus androsaceus JB14]